MICCKLSRNSVKIVFIFQQFLHFLKRQNFCKDSTRYASNFLQQNTENEEVLRSFFWERWKVCATTTRLRSPNVRTRVWFLASHEPGSFLFRDVSRDLFKNSGISQFHWMCVFHWFYQYIHLHNLNFMKKRVLSRRSKRIRNVRFLDCLLVCNGVLHLFMNETS